MTQKLKLFTLEDLLTAMELEVGDRVMFEGRENTVVKYGFDDGIGGFTGILNVIGKKYTILPKPKYTLTEEQKDIINVIPKEYKWLGRDYDGIWAFTLDPKFDYDYKDFGCVGGITADMGVFNDFLSFVGIDEKVSLDELREIAKEKQ